MLPFQVANAVMREKHGDRQSKPFALPVDTSPRQSSQNSCDCRYTADQTSHHSSSPQAQSEALLLLLRNLHPLQDPGSSAQNDVARSRHPTAAQALSMPLRLSTD